MTREKSAVVSGKFDNDTLPAIQATVSRLRELGFDVLAPVFREVTDAGGEFPVLDTDDRSKSRRELEQGYLHKIGSAALHVVVSRRDGRIGRSAAAESAYAAVSGTGRVVTTPSTDDGTHPDIWFSEELGAEERAALGALPYIRVNLCLPSTKQILQLCIVGAKPLPAEYPDRAVLTGIYERLLNDLSSTPIDAQ